MTGIQPKIDLVQWVITNTPAGSENAVEKHLGFIEAIDLIRRKNGVYLLDDYGHKYHENPDEAVLYNALISGVKGFQTLLHKLDNGPMTDEDIMDLLVATYDECEMTTPGLAISHREWLQAIGYLNRENGINRISDEGRSALNSVSDQKRIEDLQRQLRQSDMRCVPHGSQQLTDRSTLPFNLRTPTSVMTTIVVRMLMREERTKQSGSTRFGMS